MSTNNKYQDRLEKLRQSTEKKENPKLKWGLKLQQPEKKNETSEVVVRILPYKHNKNENDSFIETMVHYNLGQNQEPVLCLKENWNEDCAFDSYSEELFKQSNAIAKKLGINPKDNAAKKQVPEIAALWKIAYGLKPIKRVYCPVVIRGHEDDGVVFFGMTEKAFEDILSQCNDVEGKDPLDAFEGFDLKIVVTNDGTGFNKVSTKLLTGKSRTSAFPGKSVKEIESFLENVPNIWDVLLEKKSPDYIEDVISKLKADNQELEMIASGESIGNNSMTIKGGNSSNGSKNYSSGVGEYEMPSKQSSVDTDEMIDDLDSQLG